jgi:hypothetical protein
VVLDHLKDVLDPHYVNLKDGYHRREMGGALFRKDGWKRNTSFAAIHHYKFKIEVEEFSYKRCGRGWI